MLGAVERPLRSFAAFEGPAKFASETKTRFQLRESRCYASGSAAIEKPDDTLDVFPCSCRAIVKFGCLCHSHTLGINIAYPSDGDPQNACCVGWGTGMGLVSVSTTHLT